MNVNPRTPYRDALTFLRLVASAYQGPDKPREGL